MSAPPKERTRLYLPFTAKQADSFATVAIFILSGLVIGWIVIRSVMG